ncbi:MAG TPA: VWA domain-containing protein [Terriglobia bacterium]|nr:VWA domain-containing protein [Terriglobia bacterium]
MRRVVLWALAGSVGLSLVLLAQEGPRLRQAPEGPVVEAPGQKDQVEPPPFILRANVELVQLPITVFDKNGRIIEGLERDHFQIFEDSILQEIGDFKHEDVPLSMGLVIDNSASMRRKRERVNAAALSFVRESNEGDETFIINFDDAAYLEQDFTTKLSDLRDALENIDTRGETALYDAVYLAVDHLGHGIQDRKALLVISDGEDNVSKYGFNKLMEHIKESKNVIIYAIGILEDGDGCGGLFNRNSSCKKAKDDLEKITEATGGQAYFPKTLNDVEAMCGMIAKELRAQYLLSYTPKNMNNDGKWRNIKVAVNPPKGVAKPSVRTKQGYYAPTIPGETGPTAP